MTLVSLLLSLGGLAILLAGGLVAYAVLRATALPAGRPDRFLAEGLRRPDGKVIVCLGASITHGRVSFDVVECLARRLGPQGFQLINAGVNGDLAFNALQRLPEVISCQPDFVTVLVGTNDVLATTSPAQEARYRRMKKLPVRPTLAWYRENLEELVSTLKHQTRARIALCSLPVLGDVLESPANRRIAEYNAVVREVASKEQVSYLPVHERMAECLANAPPRAAREFHFDTGLMLKAMVQRYVLGKSWDEISSRNGFLLNTDGIHLNSKAGEQLAEQLEAFIRQAG